jgi:Ca-activated chloride channel family protein
MNEAALFSATMGETTLANPEWLGVLLPLVAIAITLVARSRPVSLEWPSLAEARAAGARHRDLVRIGSLALRAGALVALAVALGNPVVMMSAPPEPGHGLDLVLVVDASGSMRAVDTRIESQRSSRIELARRVVSRFATTRAAAGDRVALVAFGESAFTPCPLTSDGRLLSASLARIEAGIAGESTALGDALGLAVKRAIAGRASAARRPLRVEGFPSASGGAEPGLRLTPGDGPVDGRAIVLLTDGRNNAGALSLEVAAELARAEGVRVHTVAIGTAGAEIPVLTSESNATSDLDFERLDVDSEALAMVAATTGGRFFPARSADQLEAVYREIDALERVTRRLPARLRANEHPEPLLALAGACLFMEIAIARVLRRRIP